MQYTPIWSNTENVIQLFDESFSDFDGAYCIVFKNVNTCETCSVDITKIEQCKDGIDFVFSIDCKPKPGTYTANLIRKIDNEVICENLNIRIYNNGESSN